LRGVIPWRRIDHRPFLRCPHGAALCEGRLGKTREAAAAFRKTLWLNPGGTKELASTSRRSRLARRGTRWRTRSDERAAWGTIERMRRFVVDASAVLHLVRTSDPLTTGHKLLAPTLLRSQTLSMLHEAVHRGELAADGAREHLARVGKLPIRLLGDAVLRRRAWDLADQLGWASTYEAEYLALTQLQADAFVTMDAKLARKVRGVVPIASIDEVAGHRRPARRR
jgi:predicted nucleic acid-binding protein